MTQVATWSAAMAIAYGYAVVKGRRHLVRRSPDGLGWLVVEVGA
ncbi:MAG TPA: hypothetical protein VFE15_14720 [Marmoricola sp.]|nr:hypothetical protein [Marmoricola sp.]